MAMKARIIRIVLGAAPLRDPIWAIVRSPLSCGSVIGGSAASLLWRRRRVQPHPADPLDYSTSSMRAISAASPFRVPSLSTRV